MASIISQNPPRDENDPTTLDPALSMDEDSASIGICKSRPRSALWPSHLETLLLAIFPAILLLGSLFGLLDPAARHSTYSVSSQSHLQHSAPSYFAKKDNIFNVFFVKRGWAWVTFSYFLFLFTHPSTRSSSSPVFVTKRVHGFMRYCVVTLWWIFVTQWFFGPAIIDRGFKYTGGHCELVAMNGSDSIHIGEKVIFLTAATCKAAGGKWKGGHDISGHVFLLVLGTMFLLEEVLSVTLARHREDPTTKKDCDANGGEINYKKEDIRGSPEIWTLGSKVAIGVAVMNLYMLMMTAAYFHTWLEKLTGLIMAFLGIFTVFFLPRVIPVLGAILGVPEI
ncbi:unnamed protein product [Blumeria hordei]|uniref:Acyl-coenzyme A diphosphatase SCS3 n=2 Tax=Blumeria hordei TaxID=2867405 RepID=A0A383UMD5_BLUHO|nr:inositol phospholipid biosynthesis protein Scs3 [Blumeria hordei DH14]SZF01494.1 unnamed protein product [Blumeria hordei]